MYVTGPTSEWEMDSCTLDLIKLPGPLCAPSSDVRVSLALHPGQDLGFSFGCLLGGERRRE